MGAGGSASRVASTTDPALHDREEAILRALGDPVARRLLLLLNEAPQTPQALVVSSGAPQSSVYRKLDELREADLIGVLRSGVRADGHREDLFRSRIEETLVELRGGSVTVRFRLRDLASERMQTLWGDVRKEVHP